MSFYNVKYVINGGGNVVGALCNTVHHHPPSYTTQSLIDLLCHCQTDLLTTYSVFSVAGTVSPLLHRILYDQSWINQFINFDLDHRNILSFSFQLLNEAS